MKNRQNLVAVILAGGKSKRFWPLNNKNLLNFIDGNLLEYHLQTLISLGVKNFIVICNPEVAAFLRVKSKHYQNITIHRVLQDEQNLGIGRGVLLALPIIERYYSNHLIHILNCDDVYESSVHFQLIDKMLKQQPAMVVLAYQIDKYQPLGYFKIKGKEIVGIIEKPPFDKTPSNLVNMGVHLYRDFLKLKENLKIELKKSDSNDDLYERAINRICQTEQVSYVEYKGRWEILKYPWNVLSVSDYFLQKIKKNLSTKAEIDKLAKIEGEVILEEGVKVMEFAVIKGPALIKKGTIIGTGSLIRESIIGEDCVVGYHTEISRSYIGNNCWFHTNYVGDSVLGNNVNLGAGAVCANLRLDQTNIFSSVNKVKVNTNRIKLGMIAGNGVQIGVNASIMPGVKLGKNTVVGPSVILKQDLEDNTVFLADRRKFNHQLSLNSTFNDRKRFKELLER